MAKRKKSELEQIISSVQQGLNTVKKGVKPNFYEMLYPPGTSEADLADAVDRFLELQPQLVEIVEQIISLIPETFSSIWFGPEDQAGSLITRALALYDRKYCALFARLLQEQDLLHEVHQNEYIDDILCQWGLCEETALILEVRQDHPGQEGEQFLEELREEYGEELVQYLDGSKYNNVGDDGEEIGIEYDDHDMANGPVGYTVSTQSKSNSRILTLQWDEDGDVLVVSYFIMKRKESRIRAMQYPSPQVLQQAVEELRKQCVLPHYTWAQGTNAPQIETILQYGGVTLEPPCQLMELFVTNA